jgi:hypothetical protein
MHRWARLELALVAGTGAGCFMILYLAILRFSTEHLQSIMITVLGWVLVLVFILVILGPLIDRFRQALGLPPEHSEVPEAKGYLRRLGFAIAVITGILHALLHEAIFLNTVGSYGLIISSLLFTGTITYCWTLGAKRRYLKAKWLGMLGGLIIIICYFLLRNKLVVNYDLSLDLKGPLDIIIDSLDWAFVGLVGGLAIDLKWCQRPSISVPISILAARSLYFIFIVVFFAPTWNSIISTMGLYLPIVFEAISQTVGWGAGLMLAPSTDAILSPDRK